MCSIKQIEVKRIKRTYKINLVFYSTAVKNFTVSIEQINKMSISNDIVLNNFRIEIQIFQQQQKSNSEKKIHTVKTNDKKMKNKNLKFTRILKKI